MSKPEPCFALLSLPELVLMAVARCLNWKDRRSLASSCRGLAMVVSAASQDTKLMVTSQTRWGGLRKVLGTKTMACKSLNLSGCVSSNLPDNDSALDVLLSSFNDLVSGSTFPGVKTVWLNRAGPLPCLFPPNIAHVLPDLTELVLFAAPHQYAEELQPIPYCSSLRQIMFLDCIDPQQQQQQLPRIFHTAAHLQRQLPNIDSMELMGSCKASETGSCIDTMLHAWGHQLTQLLTDVEVSLQQCTRLQSLALHTSATMPLLKTLPWSLVKLELQTIILESDLPIILQPPLLREVALHGFTDSLLQDWSHHPCTWQQLSVNSLSMVELPKMPLRSLNGESCLKIACVELPDPLLPNSLPGVIHAAQCLNDLGIAVSGCHQWKCYLRDEARVEDKTDAALVELVRAASRVVQPFERFDARPYGLSHYPLTTTATIGWSSHCLQRIYINRGAEIQPWFWVALQCCSSLDTIRLIVFMDDSECVNHVHMHALLAAQHYVAITGKAIKFTTSFVGSPEELQEAALELHLKLQEQLPSTVALQEYTWRTDTELIFILSPARNHQA